MLQRGPVDSALTAPYWEAADEKRLLIQICHDCDLAIHYPRSLCPTCLSENLGWRESTGDGTVYSFSVIRRHHDPAIAERLPVVFALIDLDDGVRVLSHVVNTEPDAVAIGDRVKLRWEDAEGGPLPVYELVN